MRLRYTPTFFDLAQTPTQKFNPKKGNMVIKLTT